MNYLTVIVGPSGAGKSTLEQALVNQKGYAKVISTTTRPPREGEVHGVHYYFLSPEEFRAMEDDNKFLNTANYVGNFYGTSYSALDAAFEKGNGYAVIVAEVTGWWSFEHNNITRADADHFTTGIYLDVSTPELLRRMTNRGDTPENITKRLTDIKTEKEHYRYFLKRPWARILYQPTRKQLATFVDGYIPYTPR